MTPTEMALEIIGQMVSWNDTRMNWSIGVWYSNATEPDACPFITGYSVEDRFGCPDADSDGWSNPDSNWTAKEGADAFPENQPSGQIWTAMVGAITKVKVLYR